MSSCRPGTPTRRSPNWVLLKRFAKDWGENSKTRICVAVARRQSYNAAMKQPPFAGVFAALWTPTDGVGKLLSREMSRHIAFLRQAGVHGLFVLGTTGEFLYLDTAVRQHVLELVAEQASTFPVIANISDARPAIVAQLGSQARSLGLSAVALLPPYFYPVAAEDIIEFYVRAGEAAQLPLFLYNFPERTGNRVTLDIVQAVADRVPVAGVKHSGGDLDYHQSLVNLGRERGFVVFSGADTQLPAVMAMGVAGAVSGLANAIPEWLVAQYHAIRQNDAAAIRECARPLQAVAELMDRLSFPLNVAAAMTARGLPTGQPKTVVSPATRSRYETMVHQFNTLYAEWHLPPLSLETA